MQLNEHSCAVAYYTLLNEDREDQTERRIMSMLRTYFKSYGLSPFGLEIALHWIRRAATDDTGRLNRVKEWSLMILNSKIFPKGISDWQKGCPSLFPGLRSCPKWKTSEFPWIARLEAAFPIIKEELLALKGQRGFQPYRAPSWASKQQAQDGIGSISHEGGDWNVFYLFLHNMDFKMNRNKCPKTVELIESIPSQYHHAFFSALAPNTHVVKHHGPTNKKLRCHLPLIVPPGACTLRVGDETITIEEGKCFLFDDSFEHEARNADPEQSRIVLIIDFWHPDFDPMEQKFLSFLRESNLKQEKKACDQTADNFYSIIKNAYDTANPQAIWA